MFLAAIAFFSYKRSLCRPASVVLLVASLAVVIGESGFEAQPGPIIVSGYSGICFEIKFSGRHRGFDGVLFNL